MPPDRVVGILSLRYTFASLTLPMADTDWTDPIRATIATASGGSFAAPPNRVLPGAAVSRLVPNASRS
jgi:hypothetical protein